MRVITIDIDGVLNNYPACWLDYIQLKTGVRFTSISDAKKELGEENYKEIKFQYRTSGYKKNLPVNPSAKKLTEYLKLKGYTIVISTSRPFKDYPMLKEMTKEWLINNQIQFDFLESKNEELLTKYPNVCFHIDDELDHALFFLNNNINVLIVKRGDIHYGNVSYPTLKFVENLNDIMVLISNDETIV